MSQLNIRNAESAYLTGKARHKKWLEKFMRRWTQPIQDEMALMYWDMLPAEVKEHLEKENPEKYQEVEQLMEQLRMGG